MKLPDYDRRFRIALRLRYWNACAQAVARRVAFELHLRGAILASLWKEYGWRHLPMSLVLVSYPIPILDVIKAVTTAKAARERRERFFGKDSEK